MLTRHLWKSDDSGDTVLSPLARIIFYGLLGWSIEITFTAVVDHIDLAPEHLRLEGYTYLWMFIIWGVAFYVSELEAKAMEKRGWSFPLRWIVYMTTAWAFEYSTGWLLRRFTGHCPWNYSHAESNIDGLIRLDYGPCWILTGSISEWTHPFLDSITLRPSKKKDKQVEAH